MKRSLVLVVTLSLVLPGVSCCLAGELSEADSAQMTREQWRDHVKAARERAEIARREHKSFVPPPPTVEELAERATRHVLEDDSLMPGDIVSTNRGMFRFRGALDRERRPEDFVPVDR
jgi:hypothetical protein